MFMCNFKSVHNPAIMLSCQKICSGVVYGDSRVEPRVEEREARERISTAALVNKIEDLKKTPTPRRPTKVCWVRGNAAAREGEPVGKRPNSHVSCMQERLSCLARHCWTSII